MCVRRGLRLLLGPGLLGVLGEVDHLVDFALYSSKILNRGTGEQHRRQRKMLNPVFSVKHLREMTPLFYEVIHRVRLYESWLHL